MTSWRPPTRWPALTTSVSCSLWSQVYHKHPKVAPHSVSGDVPSRAIWSTQPGIWSFAPRLRQRRLSMQLRACWISSRFQLNVCGRWQGFWHLSCPGSPLHVSSSFSVDSPEALWHIGRSPFKASLVILSTLELWAHWDLVSQRGPSSPTPPTPPPCLGDMFDIYYLDPWYIHLGYGVFFFFSFWHIFCMYISLILHSSLHTNLFSRLVNDLVHFLIITSEYLAGKGVCNVSWYYKSHINNFLMWLLDYNLVIPQLQKLSIYS